MWQTCGLNDDEYNIMNSAMTIALLPKQRIMEGCTVLHNSTDDLSGRHTEFANQVRQLATKAKDYLDMLKCLDLVDNTIQTCLKNMECFVLKSKGPTSFLGKQC